MMKKRHYKFWIPPELEKYRNLNFVPNQYGDLLGYNDLSEEKELNQNFKKMLKEFFKYDIAKYLKHQKLKININRSLSINEDIIQKINQGFSESSKNLKEKAKEFIKFYPKNKEDNYVLQFIDSYKALTKEDFIAEEINTDNINLWRKAINILLFDLLEIIQKDTNINETSKRIELDEEKTIDKLNTFYSILFSSNIIKK